MINKQSNKNRSFKKLNDSILNNTNKYLDKSEDKNAGVEGLKLSLNKSYTVNQLFKRKRIKIILNNIKSDPNTFTIIFKDRLENILSTFKSIISKNEKKYGVIALIILILFAFLFQILLTFGSISSVIGNSMLSSSFLSEESILIAINQSYSTKELNLENQIIRVRENYPNYDEYIIKQNDYIGHDTYMLLSYFTAKFGEIANLSDVEYEIKNLFKEVYDLKYGRETETHYDSKGKPYEYRKLILTLNKNNMDEIIRNKFKRHENNLKHYEMLLESKGNMIDLFGENGQGLIPSGISSIYDFHIGGGIFPPPDPLHIASLNGGYAGQCTWYVYNRFSQLGSPIKHSPMGNGGQWAGYAEYYGYEVTRIARSGTAMCFPNGVFGASRNYGHIAFVEKVNEDGSVIVSEMNIIGEFIISVRTIPKEYASICYFINFGL